VVLPIEKRCFLECEPNVRVASAKEEVEKTKTLKEIKEYPVNLKLKTIQ
jgi:hypothetical protein